MKTYNECDIPVNVLGTEYMLRIREDSKEKRFEQMNCAGFCDQSTKELVVTNYVKFRGQISVKDIQATIRHSIRHELVHAFLYESGLGEDWEHKELGQEETTVDWIARQLEKMNEAAQSIFAKLDNYEVEIADS